VQGQHLPPKENFDFGAAIMDTRAALCKKIEEVIPNAGACGVDFDVEFDDNVQAWAMDLHHGKHRLRTFIDTNEASSCLKGDSCIPLGMQVAQLKRNFDLRACDEQEY
jgi:hypothetical protein